MKNERIRADDGVVSLNGSDGDGLPTPLDPWLHFRRELNRSRRYGHELALLWLGAPDAEELRGEELRTTVQRLMRDVDYSWVVDDRLLVLLPESGGFGAKKLVARLAAAEPALFARLEVRIAVFPEDGLTSGALLKAVAVTRGISAVETSNLDRQPLDDESSFVGRLLRLARVQRTDAPTGLPSESGS